MTETSSPALVRPVRSMTGYARVRRDTPLGQLAVSLRSVNHRGLDLHFQAHSEFAPFENAIRSLVKQSVGRGHIEVRASLNRSSGAVTTDEAANTYNRDLLLRYLAAFRQASTEFDLSTEPDLNVAFRIPGVFDNESAAESLDASFEPEVTAAFAACLAEFNATREREGQLLREQMMGETEAMLSQAARMCEIRVNALAWFQQRLEERLRELLAGAGIEPRRLAEEAALLTDRSDIQEELTRLSIHTRELRQILEQGGEVGKRLDFLLQELNRETNTILSKTSGVGDAGLTLTNLALATKANIEKIREQALNLE
ncbi:MAG: YicC/YloC family endoribonuclease [Bryobacteraceae bacterium]